MKKVQASRNQYITLFFAFSFGMILSNLIGQSAQQKQPGDEYVLAYRGIDKTLEQLPLDLAERLIELEASFLTEKTKLLKTAGLQFYLHDYAQLHSLSLDQSAVQLFDVSPPSEAELSAYFSANQNTIKKPYFEVKGAISRHLVQLKAVQARKEALDTLMLNGDLIVYTP